MEEKTEIALIKQSMLNLEKKFDSFSEDNLEAHKEIKEMVEKAMESKAGKWVEDAIRWFIYLVMGIVLSALIYLVVKN